ncbi:MAG: 8-amino-7-oxononanoate synthase [Verrucomicrobiae bacterium]|nr:8-amino-7-oxononanoate synthase [Verrucomicrobiae bacterium]
MKETLVRVIVTVTDHGDPSLPVRNARVWVRPAAGRTQARAAKASPPECVAEEPVSARTDDTGQALLQLKPGDWQIATDAFRQQDEKEYVKDIRVSETCTDQRVSLEIPVYFKLGISVCGRDNKPGTCQGPVPAGAPLLFEVRTGDGSRAIRFADPVVAEVFSPWDRAIPLGNPAELRFVSYAGHSGAGNLEITAILRHGNDPEGAHIVTQETVPVAPVPLTAVSGDVSVTMRRTATIPTPDLPLWVVIRKSTEALSFDRYLEYMNLVLCGVDPETKQLLTRPGEWQNRVFGDRSKTVFERLRQRRFLPYTDSDAYRVLKTATEAFVLTNCGIKTDELFRHPFTDADARDVAERVGFDGTFTRRRLESLWRGDPVSGESGYLEKVNGAKTLVYLKLIADKLPDVRIKRALFDGDRDFWAGLPEGCFGIVESKLTNPCLLELIWSYWNEEGMLVQTMNAISLRFQNRRIAENDPLANMEIDPLRPLNNLLWGYIQDEQHRLTLQRRSYEYEHHYGLRLEGRAVGEPRVADTRSKLIEAFHNLLHLCSVFFRQDDDTTFKADGFPLLNALKEVHRIIAEGAHNQFGDLPSTARIEMLMQQWLLARPEFREYLPTRLMVAYSEPWMDRVDAMKKLQGWTDSSIADFHTLATFGEQILLTIRYGSWSEVNDREHASNWARYWRSEIQGYIHSYRAVTSVDLTSEFTETRLHREAYLPPSVHLRRRLEAQRGGGPTADPPQAAPVRRAGRVATTRIRESSRVVR